MPVAKLPLVTVGCLLIRLDDWSWGNFPLYYCQRRPIPPFHKTIRQSNLFPIPNILGPSILAQWIVLLTFSVPLSFIIGGWSPFNIRSDYYFHRLGFTKLGKMVVGTLHLTPCRNDGIAYFLKHVLPIRHSMRSFPTIFVAVSMGFLARNKLLASKFEFVIPPALPVHTVKISMSLSHGDSY